MDQATYVREVIPAIESLARVCMAHGVSFFGVFESMSSGPIHGLAFNTAQVISDDCSPVILKSAAQTLYLIGRNEEASNFESLMNTKLLREVAIVPLEQRN
jgi:hypothetical protein